MPYEEPNPPPRIQEVRKAPSTARDLRLACETAAEIDGEVVVAVRQFPSSEYTYFYNPHDVSYVRSKLELDGYAVDSKIVMDSKYSKLILVIENENDSKRTKIVHAVKLNEQCTSRPTSSLAKNLCMRDRCEFEPGNIGLVRELAVSCQLRVPVSFLLQVVITFSRWLAAPSSISVLKISA